MRRTETSPLFSVDVLAVRAVHFTEKGQSYISLQNNTEYNIQLSNNHSTKCQVDVSVDGLSIGEWMLWPHSTIILDRRFMFVSESSDRARRSGVTQGNSNNGLITATFKPAKKVMCADCGGIVTARLETSSPDAVTTSRSRMYKQLPHTPGVTVSGGVSTQEFDRVDPLLDNEIDWSLVETVSVRLVVGPRVFDNGMVD